MRLMGELERTWKVGELARATGLTIRTLHHYDDIGLLVPARTEAGHRVYSRADVERLYRVVALRGVGMALDEIAAVLDDEGVSLIDTVRRHMAAVERDIEQRRRLLDRLRSMLDTLERSSTPTAQELIGAVEAMTVVEATIEEVITRERWQAAWELQDPYIVLLRETDGDRILPIWIGEPEARALVVQRRGATYPRPLGHDLMVALLDTVDARVERVVIERLEDNTFFATLTVLCGGDRREVDARPSDALNVAVRAGAAIHVASDVIDAAGVLTEWPLDKHLGGGEREPPWKPVGERSGPTGEPTYTIGEESPAMLRVAADEARDLGHGFVGPAHLLLAILADDRGALLLERHGVTPARARESAASKRHAQNTSSPPDATCLSPRAVSAMYRARREALRRGTAEIAPIHLLLALVDTPDAADLPGLGNTDITAVRDDVRSQLNG